MLFHLFCSLYVSFWKTCDMIIVLWTHSHWYLNESYDSAYFQILIFCKQLSTTHRRILYLNGGFQLFLYYAGVKRMRLEMMIIHTMYTKRRRKRENMKNVTVRSTKPRSRSFREEEKKTAHRLEIEIDWSKNITIHTTSTEL